MGLLEDLTHFLETRLDDFLKNNPQLELQALEEQLREQEKDAIRLILNLQKQEKKIENEILSLAQDIKLWHQRIDKAKAANRQDLAQAAQEKEASLLRLGNQRWGQMKGMQEQIRQARELVDQVRQRQQEVKAKAQQVKQSQQTNSRVTQSWNTEEIYSSGYNRTLDPLEEEFRNWEVEQELRDMKQKS
ncbi:MAG: TIGR04376 family protein [Cyanobacteria bacterium]|nr:TIGR04376 family protein [Cyanobacteria bacterium GSL.Bin21]